MSLIVQTQINFDEINTVAILLKRSSYSAAICKILNAKLKKQTFSTTDEIVFTCNDIEYQVMSCHEYSCFARRIAEMNNSKQPTACELIDLKTKCEFFIRYTENGYSQCDFIILVNRATSEPMRRGRYEN